MYCALGDEVAEAARGYLRDYYAFMGPMGEQMAQSAPTSAQAIEGAIKAWQDAGADELVLWACVADMDQVDRLAGGAAWRSLR